MGVVGLNVEKLILGVMIGVGKIGLVYFNMLGLMIVDVGEVNFV